MGLRVFGLKMEDKYGDNVDWEDYVPDYHQEVDSADFKLNDDPVLNGGGSRMYKSGRAGVMKPTGSTEGKVDLKRIGHYFRALLDNYVFTEGNGENMNVHEFYGGEGTELPSFSAVQTFDLFQKQIVGLMLDTLKLEVSDEYLTFGADWIYANESSSKIDANDYDRLEMEGDIPLMFYDVKARLNNAEENKAIQSSFDVEIKNNFDVDKTIGLGSRHPQRKANAQRREIDLSLVTTLDSETLDTILAGEYGEVGALEPSKCKIMKVPLELDVAICEDTKRKMTILFPECILSVEYDLSDADAIETTINLSAMGTGKATLKDGKEITTDIYIRLENDMSEIGVASSPSP